MKSVKPHSQFLEELPLFNNGFMLGSFSVLSNYVNNNTHVYTQDKYGICKSLPRTLLSGRQPGIRSALNEVDYFKNKLYEKNQHYRNGNFKIIGFDGSNDRKVIVENNKGKGSIRRCSLLNGCDLKIVSAIDRLSYWINSCKEVHGNRYGYDLVKRLDNKVKIYCRIHGYFLKIRSAHLMGEGCQNCGKICADKYKRDNATGWQRNTWFKKAVNSNYFDSYKLYVIKCYNDEKSEVFYKVGRTFQKIERRFRSKRDMPYNYTVIKVIERNRLYSYEDMKFIYDLECRLKRKFKEYRYSPRLEFRGHWECFRF